MAKDANPGAVKPYIPADAQLPEMTFRALLMGVILGMVFGASSLYLVLKVGLTVSASIPVAVIAITLFGLAKKVGGKDSSILENSITQTAGSAGESLAFGLGVTMPAILILGFDLEISRVMLVGVLGGLLGILMMIPMRRTMIVDQHKELKFPEGTACAEVLKAAATDESRIAAGESIESDSAAAKDAKRRAKIIFGGFAVGLLYKVFNISFKGWKDTPGVEFGAPLKAGSIGAEISPELLGVGYIIGPRIAATMAAGGVLSYLLLIPMIKFFGDNLTTVLSPGTKLISAMGADDIRSAYVLYIGAGAVAAGGLISLVRAMPMIWRSLSAGLAGMGKGSKANSTLRTEQDIPLKWVMIGCLAIIAVITFATPLHMNVLGALLDPGVRLSVRHRVVAPDRRNRLLVEPDFRHGGGHLAVYLPDLFADGLDRRPLLRHRLVGRRHRLHRRQQCRHHLAGPEDRLPDRRHAAPAAVCDPGRRAVVGADPGPDPAEAQ